MEAYLVVEQGDANFERCRLADGETVVGRSGSLALQMTDAHVSGRHLRLVCDENDVLVENLSRFGTKLNGATLENPVALRHGDRLELCSGSVLRFETGHAEDEEPLTMMRTMLAQTSEAPDYPSSASASEPAPASAEAPPPEPEARSEAPPVASATSSGSRAFVGWAGLAARHSTWVTQAAALLLMAVWAAGLVAFTQKDTWIYDFFLKRTPIQWITLYLFALLLVGLAERAWGLLRETASYRKLYRGDVSGHRLGPVYSRYLKIKARLQYATPAETEARAKALADRDAADLDAVYAGIGDMTQILPLVGFFGTVLGLSIGLYRSFVQSPDGSAGVLFGRAIGTAFDTTLLALACQIIIIILQRLLRQREEDLLSKTDALMENYIEDMASTTSSEKGLEQGDAEAAEALRACWRNIQAGFEKQMATAGQDLGDALGGASAAAAASLESAAQSAAERVREELQREHQAGAERVAEKLAAVWEAHIGRMEAVWARREPAQTPPPGITAEELGPIVDRMGEKVSDAVVRAQQPFMAEIAAQLRRPRRMNIVEVVEPRED